MTDRQRIAFLRSCLWDLALASRQDDVDCLATAYVRAVTQEALEATGPLSEDPCST